MKPSSAGSTSVLRSRHHVESNAGDGVADYDALLTCIPTIDDVLDGQASALGNDLVAYRNHVYSGCEFVYRNGGRLAPSIALVREYLVARAQEDSAVAIFSSVPHVIDGWDAGQQGVVVFCNAIVCLECYAMTRPQYAR